MVDMPMYNKLVETYLTVNYPYAGFGFTVMVIQSI